MRVLATLARVSRRQVGALALAAAGFTLAGCDLNPNTNAESLTIAPTNITVAVNSRIPIIGTAFDKKGNSIRDKKISYSTANPAIATVSADGFVIGISVGQTSVNASANGKSATAQVTVTAELVSSVVLNPAAFTLRFGQTKTFTATLKNPSGTVVNKPVRWATSNAGVATVDQNGVVTAVGTGNVIIAADVDQAIGTAQLTVTLVPIATCALSPATQRAIVGEQRQPTLVIRDSANSVLAQLNRPITWTSSNEIIATVSQTGLVTARKAGTATISASPSDNGLISCTTSIEVVDPTVDRVIINQRSGSLRIGIDRQVTASVLDSLQNIIPSRVVTWTSLTPTTARVSAIGLITGLAEGDAVIRASIDGKADTVTFRVTKVPVGSVTISPLQATVLEGGTRQFTAIVKDSTGATVNDRTIDWLTSNVTLASVDQTGLARGLAAGSVNITATVEDRGQSASLIVLQVPVDTIVAPATFTLVRGSSSGFTITLRNASGGELRNRIVEARSDNPQVAQVQSQLTQSSTITVQGISAGETNITLQALNANQQAEGKKTIVRVTVTATGAISASIRPASSR